VLQAALINGVSFDPFPFPDDCFITSEVNIGRRYVVEALMVSLVVVVFDEGPYFVVPSRLADNSFPEVPGSP